ncbi:MAG: amidohydrolase family protein, partial [Chloroflexota bacterium]
RDLQELPPLPEVRGSGEHTASDPARDPARGVQLVSCATLLPHHTGEFPPPHEHIPQLLAQGVRAVRVYPKSHTFSLASWCAGDLLAVLEAHRVPLSVELAETTWDQLHQLCGDHPQLPVLVTRVGYRLERVLYPLWARHPNLYIDLSHFQAHRAIEAAVERFGPRRLLFGTGLPFYSAGASVLAVLRAEIEAEAREAIAGRNLRQLLESVRL